MSQNLEHPPEFNLWRDPWINLERLDGSHDRASIEQTLLHAHEYASIDESSPLAAVGLHRLLVAVLQDALRPQSVGDVAAIWRRGAFQEAPLREFGERYGPRFDLFSADRPFMQSGDLPWRPDKSPGGELKTVAYLMPEFPASTAVTHHRHLYDADCAFCASCAAMGLCTIPAFATSGGAGIKPSINGVPPIYVIPGGDTLFQSLALSLVSKPFQPEIASTADLPWWEHAPVVKRGTELTTVGYVQSLTLPARRVRLHPRSERGACIRCGRESDVLVRTMIYEMGQSRPKDAVVWYDPFVGYIMPGAKAPKTAGPRPVRPQEGRVLWRDFAALFLHRDSRRARRPRVLDQLIELSEHYGVADPDLPYPFRCFGIRTDGKMKMFEWEESGFGVSPQLLMDQAAADMVQTAIDQAEEVAGIVRNCFRKKFGGPGKEQARHTVEVESMTRAYWAGLADHFMRLTGDLTDEQRRVHAAAVWLNAITATGERAFVEASERLGDDAANLRLRIEGEIYCRGALRAFTERVSGGTG